MTKKTPPMFSLMQTYFQSVLWRHKRRSVNKHHHKTKKHIGQVREKSLEMLKHQPSPVLGKPFYKSPGNMEEYWGKKHCSKKSLSPVTTNIWKKLYWLNVITIKTFFYIYSQSIWCVAKPAKHIPITLKTQPWNGLEYSMLIWYIDPFKVQKQICLRICSKMWKLIFVDSFHLHISLSDLRWKSGKEFSL